MLDGLLGFFDFDSIQDFLGTFATWLVSQYVYAIILVMFFEVIFIIVVNVTTLVYVFALATLTFNIPAMLGAGGSLAPSGSINGTYNNSAMTKSFENDAKLTPWNSVYGYIILGSCVFLVVLIICGALLYNIFGVMRNEKDKGNTGQLQIKMMHSDSMFKNMGLGLIFGILAFLLIGIAYAALTFVTIALCFVVTELIALITDSFYASYLGPNGSAATYNNMLPMAGSNTVYIPVIYPMQGSTIAGAQPVALPVYLYYELFRFAGFDPAGVSVGSIAMPIGGLGSFLSILRGPLVWTMVPWYIVILAVSIWLSAQLLKFAWRGIERFVILVMYFLAIIIFACYALFDGGLQLKAAVLSAVKWFFYNIVYVVILGVWCLITFVFVTTFSLMSADITNAFNGQNTISGWAATVSRQTTAIAVSKQQATKAVLVANSNTNILQNISGVAGVIQGMSTMLFNVHDIYTTVFMVLGEVVGVVVSNKLIAEKIDTAYFKDDQASAVLKQTKDAVKQIGTTYMVPAALVGVGAAVGAHRLGKGLVRQTKLMSRRIIDYNKKRNILKTINNNGGSGQYTKGRVGHDIFKSKTQDLYKNTSNRVEKKFDQIKNSMGSIDKQRADAILNGDIKQLTPAEEKFKKFFGGKRKDDLKTVNFNGQYRLDKLHYGRNVATNAATDQLIAGLHSDLLSESHGFKLLNSSKLADLMAKDSRYVKNSPYGMAVDSLKTTDQTGLANFLGTLPVDQQDAFKKGFFDLVDAKLNNKDFTFSQAAERAKNLGLYFKPFTDQFGMPGKDKVHDNLFFADRHRVKKYWNNDQLSTQTQSLNALNNLNRIDSRNALFKDAMLKNTQAMGSASGSLLKDVGLGVGLMLLNAAAGTGKGGRGGSLQKASADAKNEFASSFASSRNMMSWLGGYGIMDSYIHDVGKKDKQTGAEKAARDYFRA